VARLLDLLSCHPNTRRRQAANCHAAAATAETDLFIRIMTNMKPLYTEFDDKFKHLSLKDHFSRFEHQIFNFLVAFHAVTAPKMPDESRILEWLVVFMVYLRRLTGVGVIRTKMAATNWRHGGQYWIAQLFSLLVIAHKYCEHDNVNNIELLHQSKMPLFAPQELLRLESLWLTILWRHGLLHIDQTSNEWDLVRKKVLTVGWNAIKCTPLGNAVV